MRSLQDQFRRGFRSCDIHSASRSSDQNIRFVLTYSDEAGGLSFVVARYAYSVELGFGLLAFFDIELMRSSRAAFRRRRKGLGRLEKPAVCSGSRCARETSPRPPDRLQQVDHTLRVSLWSPMSKNM